MKKVLLREFFELKCDERGCQDLLTESEKKMINEGFLVFPAKLQEADAVNGNNRVYTEKVLRKEIKNYQSLVQDARALGECDHPDDSVINLKNASHMVSRIWWDGKNVLGTIKVLKTPSGQILRGLYESGVKFGFSSRALGTLQEGKDGVQVVQEDLQLICFDAVSEPSAPGAYYMGNNVNIDVGAVNIAEGQTHISDFLTKNDRINRILNDILDR